MALDNGIFELLVEALNELEGDKSHSILKGISESDILIIENSYLTNYKLERDYPYIDIIKISKKNL
jgi:hypothetical protein